jgi:hypothetical protein
MTAQRLGAWLATVLVMTIVAPAHGAGVDPTAPLAPAAVAGDINARGFEQLNACLASAERVDALYVADVSGSLVSNDPDGRRFEALEASVAQLGMLAEGARGTGRTGRSEHLRRLVLGAVVGAGLDVDRRQLRG